MKNKTSLPLKGKWKEIAKGIEKNIIGSIETFEDLINVIGDEEIYEYGCDMEEELNESDYEKLLKYLTDPRIIAKAGNNWKFFDYEMGMSRLEHLVEFDLLALLFYEEDLNVIMGIVEAGKTWKQFDFNMGIKMLVDCWETIMSYDYGNDTFEEKYGVKERVIMVKAWKEAQKHWKEFNVDYAMELLIKKDTTGEAIYYAGVFWENFNYKKGLVAFKKIIKKMGGKWKRYKTLLKDWEGKEKEVKDEREMPIFYVG